MSSKYYNEDISKIKSIKFGIYGNDEVKNSSVILKDPYGINIPESYDNYEPKYGGLVDSRLGTCDIHLECSTCGLDTNDCPGHFGHTDLSEPVFHYGYLNHLRNILGCVCLSCSKLLVNNEDFINEIKDKSRKIRFNEIKIQAKKINNCPNCNELVPKIKKEIKQLNATIKIIAEYELSATAVENTEVTEDFEKKRHIKKKNQHNNVMIY